MQRDERSRRYGGALFNHAFNEQAAFSLHRQYVLLSSDVLSDNLRSVCSDLLIIRPSFNYNPTEEALASNVTY